MPWLFDEESVDVLREFTRLKMRLMPYLAGAARQAYGEGLPMMRAMVVEFPDDPGCTHLERQYMLGEDLLVAPVFSSDGDVSYYVPGGVWTHYLTGERIEGGRWVRERHGFDSVPLLVRPGAVIPVGAVEDRPDYDHADDVTLRVYEPSDGSAVVTQIGDTSFTTTRNGENVRVTGEGAWNVLLVNARVAGVEGGEVADHPLGVLIKATGGELLITLEEEN
nr:TIM-barrel domain-containing protein [Actinomadura madurae]